PGDINSNLPLHALIKTTGIFLEWFRDFGRLVEMLLDRRDEVAQVELEKSVELFPVIGPGLIDQDEDVHMSVQLAHGTLQEFDAVEDVVYGCEFHFKNSV